MDANNTYQITLFLLILKILWYWRQISLTWNNFVFDLVWFKQVII